MILYKAVRPFSLIQACVLHYNNLQKLSFLLHSFEEKKKKTVDSSQFLWI